MTNNVVKVDWERLEASNIAYSRYENRLVISYFKEVLLWIVFPVYPVLDFIQNSMEQKIQIR